MVNHRRILSAVLAVFVLAAIAVDAGPATGATAHRAAGFQPFYIYSAVFTGSGTYKRTLSTDGVLSIGSSQTDASFSWKTTYANILIPQVRNRRQVGFPAVKKGSTAKGTWQITSDNGDGDTCTGAGTLGRPSVNAGPIASGGLQLQRTPSKAIQFFANGLAGFATASGGGDGSTACRPSDFWHDVVISGGGVGQGLSDNIDPLTAIGAFKSADMKKASFTKTVQASVDELPQTDCGSGGGNTCTQSYNWTGKITFTKKLVKKK